MSSGLSSRFRGTNIRSFVLANKVVEDVHSSLYDLLSNQSLDYSHSVQGCVA